MSDRVWLVTGGTGQVGSAIAASPPPGVRIIAPLREELDLADPALDPSVLIAAQEITAILNCGAYTQVDLAESEEDLATQINGQGAGILARAAALVGIPIVQVSTDYVFPGDKLAPYVEDDPTAPRSAYGRSKLEGEKQVSASGARHAIVRTSWVFSEGGLNFLRTMLRLGSEREVLRVVADQHGCPTHAGDLAQALIAITTALERGKCQSGIWHIANGGETTWNCFAERIFTRAALHGRSVPKVLAIPAADFPTAAVRPVSSRLSTLKAQGELGITLRRWQDASDAAVDALLKKEITA